MLNSANLRMNPGYFGFSLHVVYYEEVRTGPAEERNERGIGNYGIGVSAPAGDDQSGCVAEACRSIEMSGEGMVLVEIHSILVNGHGGVGRCFQTFVSDWSCPAVSPDVLIEIFRGLRIYTSLNFILFA